jgi:hypothetical protein
LKFSFSNNIYSIVDKNSFENSEKMVEWIKEFSKSWY